MTVAGDVRIGAVTDRFSSTRRGALSGVVGAGLEAIVAHVLSSLLFNIPSFRVVLVRGANKHTRRSDLLRAIHIWELSAGWRSHAASLGMLAIFWADRRGRGGGSGCGEGRGRRVACSGGRARENRDAESAKRKNVTGHQTYLACGDNLLWSSPETRVTQAVSRTPTNIAISVAALRLRYAVADPQLQQG